MSRSNSANIANMSANARPLGVIRSSASLSETKPTFRAVNGDYVWPAEPLGNAFPPLRNPRAEFLDAA